MKTLSKLKNGEKVMSALTKPLFFDDIRRHTCLDPKTLQAALARLQKHGYVRKDSRGLWEPTGDLDDQLREAEEDLRSPPA